MFKLDVGKMLVVYLEFCVVIKSIVKIFELFDNMFFIFRKDKFMLVELEYLFAYIENFDGIDFCLSKDLENSFRKYLLDFRIV